MKQILILLFLTLGIFESLSGQVNVGISTGLNISKCKITDIGLVFTTRKGYFVGIAPSYLLNEKIHLIFDLQYSQKGYAINPFLEYRFSYFEIIPEIEYRPVNFLVLGLGISYGYRVNEEERGIGDWESTRDIKLIKSFDYGVTGKIKLIDRKFFGFVRYNIGLNEISNPVFFGRFGNLDEINMYNRNLQFGVGYVFGLERYNDNKTKQILLY